MANQSIKQQIIDSMVQKAIAQNREQEVAKLNADFAAFQNQQRDPEMLQADFSNFLKSQSQPVQQPTQKQTIPSLVDYVNMPGNQYDKKKNAETISKIYAERQARRDQREKNKELKWTDIQKSDREAIQAQKRREDYQRQQQEEQMLAERKAVGNKREVAKSVKSNNIPKASIINSGIVPEETLNNIANQQTTRFNPFKNNNTLVMNTSSPEVLSSGRSEIDDLADIFKASMKDYAPKFTYRGNKWENPYDNLTEEQKQLVRDYIIQNQNNDNLSKEDRETLKAFYKAYQSSSEKKVDGYDSNAARLNSMNDLERTLQAGAAGFTDFNLPLAELAEKGLSKIPAISQINDQSKVDDLRKYIDESKALNESAANTGRTLGQIYDYAVTSPIIGGVAASAGLGNKGTVVLNQLIQAAQDLGLDIYPEVQRMLREEGKIDWGELAKRFGTDIVQNISMEAIPFLGAANYDSLVKTVGNNADIFKIIDATGALKNVPDYIRSATDAMEKSDKVKFTPQTKNPDGLIKNSLDELDNASYHEGAKNVGANNGGINYGTERNGIQPTAGGTSPRTEITDIQKSGGMDEKPGTFRQGNNGVLGNDVSEELRQKMTNAGIRDVGLKYNTDAKTFSNALEEARKLENNSHGVFVSGKDPEEVQRIIDEGGKALLSDDGTAGLLVTHDGDIEGVFYNKALAEKLGKPKGGAFHDLMITAIANGGKKLDCYGNGLAHMYAQMGFEPVVATKYVPDKPWSAEMDAWRELEANKLAKEGKKADGINTDVYAFKLRDGFTAEDALEAATTGSLKEYANSLDYSLEAVNKNAPKNLFDMPEDDIYDAMLKYRDSLMEEAPKQGAIFNGGNPNKVMAEDTGISKVPQEPETVKTSSSPLAQDVNTPEGMRERGQSQHIRGAGKMQMEDVADEVVADFQNDPDMYKVLKNADTKARAEKIFNESPDVEADFRSMLAKKDPASLPLGQAIAKQYSAAGKHDIAAQIYRDMGEALTEAGQFSQAAIINMIKDDPLTALRYAQKEIDQLNAAGLKRYGKKWKDFSLLDDEVKLFDSITPGDTEAIKNAFDQIGVRLGQEYPTTLLDKVIELRRAAMLFNPRTISRNFLANPPTMVMRWWADRHEALGQQIAHLINPEVEVTQSLYGSGPTGRKIAKEVYSSDRLKSLIENMNSRADIPELKNAVMRNKQTFKGAFLSKWVDKLTNGGIEKLNEKMGHKGTKSLVQSFINGSYEALNVTDNPAVRENFVERLGSYIAAKKIKNAADIPDDAILMAWEESMKATYKDNSQIAKGIKGVKNAIKETGDGFIPGLGSVISQSAIPFTTAPGNIGQRMIDYSVVGLGKGIYKIIKGAKTNDLKLVQKGIEEAAKGMSGTELVILGMKLRESGILTGTYSENKKQKAFQKQDGFREFALHLGNAYHSIDWMEPFAEPVMAGALIWDAIEKSDELDSELMKYLGYEGTGLGKIIGVGKEATKTAVNSWFNATPLQNLAEMLGGGGYGKSDIAGNIWENGVADFAGAMVPSAVAATAKVVDPVQRNTYDPSNGVGTFVNTQVAKLPVLSKTLPAKYDVWGEEMKYGSNRATAAFSKYLYPGDYAETKNDPVNKEINRLFDATKDNNVFPPTAEYSVGDKKLNNREVSVFQEDMGKRNHKLAETFIDSDLYKSLEGKDSEKAEILKNLYGTSKVITQRDQFSKPVADNSQYKKAVAAYDAAGGGEEGIKAIVNYYTGKEIADSAGIKPNSNDGKEIIAAAQSGNIEGAEELANNTLTKKEVFQKYGYDTSSDVYNRIYDNYGGEKGLQELNTLGSVSAFYTYQNALSEPLTTMKIPSIEDYAKNYSKIDSYGNKNGSVTQDEMAAYLNAGNYTLEQATDLAALYGDWKYPPRKTKNNKWTLKK